MIPGTDNTLDLNDIEDENEENQQWVVLYGKVLIGYYPSEREAYHAMDGYRLNHILDIDSSFIVRQIV